MAIIKGAGSLASYPADHSCKICSEVQMMNKTAEVPQGIREFHLLGGSGAAASSLGASLAVSMAPMAEMVG